MRLKSDKLNECIYREKAFVCEVFIHISPEGKVHKLTCYDDFRNFIGNFSKN